MTKSDVRRLLRRSFIAGSVAALWGSSSGAFAIQGYVSDSYGRPVHSATGECIRSPDWRPTDANLQCDVRLYQSLLRPVQAPMEQPAPPPEAHAPQAPAPVQPRRVRLDADTTFSFNKAELTDAGRRDLDRIISAARQTHNQQIRVTGYTDRLGSEQYNEDLSRRRAEAVRDYLVQNGIPEEIITVEARGEADPLVTCENTRRRAELIECLRPNRRSEIEFAAFEPVPMQNQQNQQYQHQGTLPPRGEAGAVSPPGASTQQQLPRSR